jgi:hypothetical protein
LSSCSPYDSSRIAVGAPEPGEAIAATLRDVILRLVDLEAGSLR